MIQNFNDFISYIETELRDKRKMDKLEVMLELQRELNRFIDTLRNIHRWDDEEWVKKYVLAMSQEVSELIDGLNWKWWTNPKKIDRNYILEEIVDILHFLLSAYLQKGMNAEEICIVTIGEDTILQKTDTLDAIWDYIIENGEIIETEDDVIDKAMFLQNILTEIYLSGSEYLDNYSTEIWECLITIAQYFNLTPSDVYNCYIKKNYENRMRQLNKDFRSGLYYAIKEEGGV